MAGEKILIVDDDDDIREVLKDRLEAHGYLIDTAENGVRGLEAMKKDPPDLIFLDLSMPELDGFGVLNAMKREKIESVVVVITAHGSLENAVEAMRLGAFDFVPKPFDTSHLEVVLEKGLERVSIKREHTVLQETIRENTPEMVVEAPVMTQVIELAKRAADSNATVLILGESGTGKEVLAQAIHSWSDRADEPFVAVNCAALPDELLESALFGHERGSFTGAVGQKKGKFELASGGTILLDEIGELKLELQSKLLRVLQEGVFERVGGTQAIPTDVRVLAATNRNLEEEMAQGNFREDLFFRLNVVALTMPPLRDRVEDIPALANYFLGRYGKEAKQHYEGISEAAMECMVNYPWPGNVRELANAIERAVVLGLGETIDVEDLPNHIVSGRKLGEAIAEDEGLPFHEAVDAYRRHLIVDALDKADGNQSQAAEALGLQRTYLARLITNLGLRR